MTPILDVRELTTAFASPSGPVRVLDGVDFHVEDGEILGIVGESGSGKTITALSVTQLLPAAATIHGGEIHFRGSNLLALSQGGMNRIRGRQISMIFQSPRSTRFTAWRRRSGRSCGRIATCAVPPRGKLPWNCWTTLASQIRRASSASTRTNSRAGCASA